MPNPPQFSLNREDQNMRRAKLRAYLQKNVLRDGKFVCKFKTACKNSCAKRGVDFSYAQLHHIGNHYSLLRNGKPMRIVIIGEQYGRQQKKVSLEFRYKQVLSGEIQRPRMEKSFKENVPPWQWALNPHMTGTLAVLRFLLDKPVRAPYRHADSYLCVDGEAASVFDCFALTNFLLCSAHKGGKSKTVAGGVMWENCREHIAEVLKILEPTHVVLQGAGKLFSSVKHVFGNIKKHEHVKSNKLGFATHVFSFTHPSTPSKDYGWGIFTANKNSYLRATVEKTIRQIKN